MTKVDPWTNKQARSRLDELRGSIRACGLRATPARISVLDALRSAQTPLSHAELVLKLAPQERDRTTIFRTLAVLTRAGLVFRIDLGDHVWRFTAEGATGSVRAQFVCTQCGAIEALANAHVLVASEHAPRAVGKREIELRLHGLCDACS